MKRFAFVSRHMPTEGQIALSMKAGIQLVHVGDRDGFTLEADEFIKFDGVIVVHAQAALRAICGSFFRLRVGVFNNVNRAPLGEKPSFEATSLVVSGFGRFGIHGSTLEEVTYSM